MMECGIVDLVLDILQNREECFKICLPAQEPSGTSTRAPLLATNLRRSLSTDY
jgi:hypothetical protein